MPWGTDDNAAGSVSASLIARVDAAVPGTSFRAALVLKHQPGWHTYWSHPGDSGLPTVIKWENLPGDVEIGAFQWPVPMKFGSDGIISYVYEGTTIIPFTVTVPKSTTGERFTLGGVAEWLVCTDKTCVPGSGMVSLELPIGTEANVVNAADFEAADQALPMVLPAGTTSQWQITAEGFELTVRGPLAASALDFFPQPPEGLVLGATRKIEFGTDSDTARFFVEVRSTPIPAGGIPGVLVVGSENDRRGYLMAESNASPAGSEQQPPVGMPTTVPDNSVMNGASQFSTLRTEEVTSIWQALLYAFLGGLILNLMPCVLPAISLKIVGFIQQAGEFRRKIFLHGLAFATGVFAWFWGMAALVVGVKSLGGELSWAFQFQNPWLVLGMGVFLVLFALNLFGVYEVQLPGQAGTALSEVSSRKGYAGSFLHGVFATILATPCTAPFLGSALGFAFAAPVWMIPVVFTAIAAGMASPYLLLAAQPGWLSLLPKPGEWMNRLKEFMGFLLLATALWLVWLLGQMKGTDAAIYATAWFLVIGLLAWIIGHTAGPLATPGARRAGLLAVTAVLGSSLWFGLPLGSALFTAKEAVPQEIATGPTVNPSKSGEFAWLAFSKANLETALSETAEPIFVDYTADWCWTCKGNEQTVLSRTDIQKAFVSTGFRMMKGDFTNFDPEIKAEIDFFRRGGVPMYVVYPSDRARPPILLPELLTVDIVLEAIAAAK